MKSRFSLVYVIGLIALIVLPTAVTLAVYHVTKDPNWRPLGVTEESLAAHARQSGRSEGVQIVAQVEWVGPVAARMSRRQFERSLTNAFRAKGVDVYVFFTSGIETTQVTYVVGYSRIGPFPVHRASQGVRAAVDAYHMYVPAG
ncbi:hypothetical protein [Maritimibacter dapengensis]|uniref:Uncharacterized protein n=1 Tax=Maritimibacter dapengensis TaxID=2836868 RepID=A0ABS6T368_9RHOB|nr:hypothetical protein [Maritimibacter dapengensis]MBV7379701.1 hypothetical protein [Maritimibacter dapengensis]